MQHTIRFFVTFLNLFLASLLSAQQGNVTAGGDTKGTGGLMSYSIGQTEYLYYSSEQGSISLGLQQTWHISTEPPPTLDISDMVIESGESLCFNALETIIVAGDGNQFIIEAYGHTDIIAGQKILLRFGTSVELHGSLHARISSSWCPPIENLLASFESETKSISPGFDNELKTSFFKVYPNPTTGDFTLELLEFDENSSMQLEIYTMQGYLFFSNELPLEQSYTISLAERQPGIYLIRVLKDNEKGILKIIKQ